MIDRCGVWALLLLLAFSSDDERDKFEFLYRKYKSLLLHKAYEILRDYALAEDAVSDAYLRIYKNLHKIDDPASNRSIAFVVTIAKNAALTMLQREKSRQTEEADESMQDSFNLEQSVLSKLSTEKIFAVVGSLDEDAKSIFMLKFTYDMSHKEIAEHLGLSENNVTVKLHRAKKKLADLLGKEG